MIGELLAIFSVLTFVISNAIFRRVDFVVSSSQINAFRTIIGAITYIIISFILKKFLIIFTFPPIIWFWLVLSIVFGQMLGDTSYFRAQEKLGTTLAMTISMTFPIFTTIISIIIGETIPYYFFISLALVVIGVIIIAFSKNNDRSTNFDSDSLFIRLESETYQQRNITLVEKNNEMKSKIKIKKSKLILINAICIALFAAFSWAIGIILTEKAINEVSIYLDSSEYSSLLGNVVRFAVISILLSVMSFGDKKQPIKKWNRITWLLLVLGAVIGTSLGAYLYTEAINRTSAAFVSIIGSSGPIFAIPIAWLINREKINLKGLIGVLLTCTGVILLLVFQLLK